MGVRGLGWEEVEERGVSWEKVWEREVGWEEVEEKGGRLGGKAGETGGRGAVLVVGVSPRNEDKGYPPLLPIVSTIYFLTNFWDQKWIRYHPTPPPFTPFAFPMEFEKECIQR